MGKTHYIPLAARHGRGTAWARHSMCESALSLSMEPETKVFVKSKKYSTSAYQWNSTTACFTTYVKTTWNYELRAWWGKRRSSEEGKMELSARQTAARHRIRSYISGGGTDFSLLRNFQTNSGAQPDSKSM